VGKKNDLINLNKKAKLRLNLRMIIFSLLIVFIIVLFFNNFKLYKKTEVLNKEIELLNKEKEAFNFTNKFIEKIKLVKDRDKYKFEKDNK
jgi:hypothetical protein